MTSLTFVTSNVHKFKEAEIVAQKYSYSLRHEPMEYEEIQHSSLEEIARKSAEVVSNFVSPPFFLEDAGFFVNSLKGFPGPYSSYVNKTISWQGVLKLLVGYEDRSAYFLSVIAYVDKHKQIHLFKGLTKGIVSLEGRGNLGFGFDPIFIPLENNPDQRTYAEMNAEEKSQTSHRSKALHAFFSSLPSLSST